MRVLLWLLLAAILVLIGAYPALATVLAGAVALAVTGAVALLVQPPILFTVLAVLVADAARRRFA